MVYILRVFSGKTYQYSGKRRASERKAPAVLSGSSYSNLISALLQSICGAEPMPPSIRKLLQTHVHNWTTAASFPKVEWVLVGCSWWMSFYPSTCSCLLIRRALYPDWMRSWWKSSVRNGQLDTANCSGFGKICHTEATGDKLIDTWIDYRLIKAIQCSKHISAFRLKKE